MRWLSAVTGVLSVMIVLLAGQTHVPMKIAQAVQPTPTVVPLIPPPAMTPTPIRITAPPETGTPIPTNTPRYTATPALVEGDHFWFLRPFAYDPNGVVKDYPARGYAYGSNAGGLSTHHGIDIENRTGTFVRAVANGTVIFAGDDLTTMIGPRTNFYGKAIIIQHNFSSPDGRPVYSLYGHLSQVNVEVGQVVEAGDNIGGVGAEGVAFGPHLHLEVRFGDPFDYYSTYNPELWTEPWRDHGVFAARIINEQGEPVYGQRVELIMVRGDRYFAGMTYADNNVNSDPALRENIVIGDMPAGTYEIKVGEIRNVKYRGEVVIAPHTVNFVEIVIP